MATLKQHVAGVAVLALAGISVVHAQERYGIGHVATPAEIAGWNIDVNGSTGKNLPAGSGSVQRGQMIFDRRCAACHGAKGEGGIGDRLVGGEGTLASANPIRTVGSYWEYAPTLFDYIRRAMPMNAPESLTSDEVYAVSAYVLYLNGLVPEDTTLDAKSLAAIKMPNRNGFIPDPRPDIREQRCMSGC
jgi:cytochrome c